MKKIKKFIEHAVPNKNNNLLLPGFPQQLLKVIKYYCSGSSRPGVKNNFLKCWKQCASTGSSRKHTSNAHAHTNHSQCTGSTGHGVLPGSQLKK